MSVAEVLAPDMLHAHELDRAGWLALYGDPDAPDPFAEPWVLAVAQVGNEDSSLGDALDPPSATLSWTRIDLEQQDAEPPGAGLLSSGLSTEALQHLADGAEVDRAVKPYGITISLDPAPADEAHGGPTPRLELVAAGPLPPLGLSSASYQSGVAPQVSWRASDPEATRWTVGVTSFAADPELELLLRATIGGAQAGTVAIPVSSGPVTSALAVRRVEGTTALVQGSGYSADELDQVADSLLPAGDDDWAAFEESYRTSPPSLGGLTMTPAEAVIHGPALDGRFGVAIDVATRQGPYGMYEACDSYMIVEYPDGSFDGGLGSSGSPCLPDWSLSQVDLRRGTATLIYGDVPAGTSRVTFTLSDGTVVEPELVGTVRLQHATVVDGVATIVAGEAYDASGVVFSRVLQPVPGAPGASQGVRTGPP